MGRIDSPTSIALNNAMDRASLTDGRARFRAIFHAGNEAHGRASPDWRPTDQILHDLGGEEAGVAGAVPLNPIPANVRVIAVAGFLTECIAFLSNVLTDAVDHLQSLGAQTLVPRLDGRGGAAHNARQLRDAIMGLPEGETVILLAMSKGAVDAQEMLARYPETHARVHALVSLVGAVWGSPLAHMAPDWLKWIEANIPMPHCRAHGGAAVYSLTPEVRRAFLDTHAPVPIVRYYSMGAVVDDAGMSAGMRSAFRALSTIGPNDGQMLLTEQMLPSSELLGVLNGDHIAVGMPFNRNCSAIGRWVTRRLLDQNAFPPEVMAEAIVRRVLEDL